MKGLPQVHNPMCDGSWCSHSYGTVKLYPTGGGGNMIYCVDCFRHENAYRAMRRNEKNVDPENFPSVPWDTAKVYTTITIDDRPFD